MAFDRVWKRLPTEVRASLSEHQLRALAIAMSGDETRHKIDFRASLPFFGKRYYLRLVSGRERRNVKRLKREGQLGLKEVSIVYAVMACSVIGIFMTFMIASLYILKSYLGLDFIPGSRHCTCGS